MIHEYDVKCKGTNCGMGDWVTSVLLKYYWLQLMRVNVLFKNSVLVVYEVDDAIDSLLLDYY